MSFRVRLTASAAADFERRLTTLAERSPAAALRLNDRFEAAGWHAPAHRLGGMLCAA